MATQLQRALGLGGGKEPVPKPDDKKGGLARAERRSDKKGGDKGDPFPNLPRRPFGVDLGS